MSEREFAGLTNELVPEEEVLAITDERESGYSTGAEEPPPQINDEEPEEVSSG